MSNTCNILLRKIMDEKKNKYDKKLNKYLFIYIIADVFLVFSYNFYTPDQKIIAPLCVVVFWISLVTLLILIYKIIKFLWNRDYKQEKLKEIQGIEHVFISLGFDSDTKLKLLIEEINFSLEEDNKQWKETAGLIKIACTALLFSPFLALVSAVLNDRVISADLFFSMIGLLLIITLFVVFFVFLFLPANVRDLVQSERKEKIIMLHCAYEMLYQVGNGNFNEIMSKKIL